MQKAKERLTKEHHLMVIPFSFELFGRWKRDMTLPSQAESVAEWDGDDASSFKSNCKEGEESENAEVSWVVEKAHQNEVYIPFHMSLQETNKYTITKFAQPSQNEFANRCSRLAVSHSHIWEVGTERFLWPAHRSSAGIYFTDVVNRRRRIWEAIGDAGKGGKMRINRILTTTTMTHRWKSYFNT